MVGAVKISTKRPIVRVFWVILWIAFLFMWALYLVGLFSKTPLKTSTEVRVIDVSPEIESVPWDIPSIRIDHLKTLDLSIKQAINRGKDIPIPEDAIEISFAGTPLLHQWYVWNALFSALGINELKDPTSGNPYMFVLSADKTQYQFLSFGDEDNDPYSSGGSLAVGDSEWNIVTKQEMQSDRIDLVDSRIRDKLGLHAFQSCLDIYQSAPTSLSLLKSKEYVIYINGIPTRVFCDMQTDGGWWTLFYANNGYENSPVKKSYVEMRETMKIQQIQDFSSFYDPYLAGLLDYEHFLNTWSYSILIRNRTGENEKWVKLTFDSPKTLRWALGNWVMHNQKANLWCLDLPRKGFWGITNNNQTVSYQNLHQIMNHQGVSWWISHEKFPCNWYQNSLHPHIAFYHASSSEYLNRARSNDGIGGLWWEWWEYRYFIR